MPLHFVLSKKKHRLLQLNGFLHNRQRVNKDSVVWKCIKYKETKCPGEVHTNNQETSGISD